MRVWFSKTNGVVPPNGGGPECRGISRQFFEGEPIGPKEALQFGEKLKPWRAAAAWYLWRSQDPRRG